MPPPRLGPAPKGSRSPRPMENGLSGSLLKIETGHSIDELYQDKTSVGQGTDQPVHPVHTA